MGKGKRTIDILVLSDIHLGSFGCNAKDLLVYLKSIKPKKVILNGDIVDIWQFNKRYWPKSHTKVIKHVFKWISKDVPVYLIPGNHDELFRRFVGFQLGSFKIENQFHLDIDGSKAWFFHGDVFDVTMQHSKWLAKIGAIGYDGLILINKVMNVFSEMLGRGKLSFSKKIKNSVKGAVSHINKFEETAADMAADNDIDYVICGHIHQPTIKTYVTTNGKKVTYLNSGDWIENNSALEYNNGEWSLYFYQQDIRVDEESDIEELEIEDQSYKEIFKNLAKEFHLL